MRAIAPSMPPQAFPRQGRRRPARGRVPQAPTKHTCVSGRAPAAKLRPTTQTRRRYIAARANLPLHRQSRIYLLCPAVQLPCRSSTVAAASRRWLRRTTTSTWPKQILRYRTRPHKACSAGPLKPERSEWHSHLNSPSGMHVRAPPAFPVSRAKLPHGVCHVSLLLPALFSRLLPAFRLLLRARLFTCRRAGTVREIVHILASWCGNNMGASI